MKFIFYLLFIFITPGALAFLEPKHTQNTKSDLVISLETSSLKNNTHVIKRPLTKSGLQFNKAIEVALDSFKNDYDEGNQTPLDLILEKSFEKYAEGSFDDNDLTQIAKKELADLLLSKGTTFVLVNNKKAGEELGFDPSENWVFELKVPSIKGFTFWCVVSKLGEEEPFTFGEN